MQVDSSNPEALSGPLARVETARRLLAEARTVDEIKTIRDMAEQMRLYAQQAKLGLEAQNSAAEVRIRAERRGGELLKDVPRGKPGPDPVISHSGTHLDFGEAIKDAGISNRAAYDWQAIAAIPEQIFERHIEDVKESDAELTTKDAVKLGRVFKQNEMEEAVQQINEQVADETGSDPNGDLERARFHHALSVSLKEIGKATLLHPDVVAAKLDEQAWDHLNVSSDRWQAWITAVRAEREALGVIRLVGKES